MPKAVVTALMDQFKIRERQIQDAPKLGSDPFLTAIAEALPKQEWTTGRRLRKLTGLEVDAFNRHLRRFIPRYVRVVALHVLPLFGPSNPQVSAPVGAA